MSDAPLKIVMVQRMTAEQLRAEVERWRQYRGMPFVVSPGHEVEIVLLQPERIEPAIEDEP